MKTSRFIYFLALTLLALLFTLAFWGCAIYGIVCLIARFR